MQQDYVFTDLEDQQELVKDIEDLEEKLRQSTGEKINLIAYSEISKKS